MKRKKYADIWIWGFVISILLGGAQVMAQEQSAKQAENPAIMPDGQLPPDRAHQLLLESKSDIKRVQEETMLLKKVVEEIDTPMTGVEEVIRQEKMRMLLERINNNIALVETMRKEQDRNLDVQRQQRLIQQQRNLPKR